MANKEGAPSAFKPEFVEQSKKLCELGATDKEVADFFDVSERTINRWKSDFPEFCQSLKAGKDLADDRVERSLYQKAIGYSYESEKVFQFQGDIVRAPIIEHVPPDTTAMIFWLKNRRAKDWRDVHKLEHGKAGDFDSLTDAELRDIVVSEAGEVKPRKGRTRSTGTGTETPPKGLRH